MEILFDFIGNLGNANDAYGHAFWQLNNDIYMWARNMFVH